MAIKPKTAKERVKVVAADGGWELVVDGVTVDGFVFEEAADVQCKQYIKAINTTIDHCQVEIRAKCTACDVEGNPPGVGAGKCVYCSSSIKALKRLKGATNVESK